MSISRISRRQFLKAAAVLGVAEVAAACAAPAAPTSAPQGAAAPTAEPAQAAPVASGPTTINLWWWTSEPWKSAAEAYNGAQDKIKVNLSEIGDAVFGDQKYMTAAAAGTGPDASIQNRHTFMQFAAKGLYLSLDDYFQAAGLKKDDFYPVQYGESTWDGHLYGIPLYTDTRHLYWNRTHLNEVGLTEPPKSWNDLETYADKLNKKNDQGDFDRMGFVPYLVGNSWMWMYGFLNKAPSISDDKRTILCDDPKWADALEWLVNFYDKHLGSFEIASAFNQGFATQTQDLFAQQRCSMQITTDDSMSLYLRFPDLDFAVSPAPYPETGEKSSLVLWLDLRDCPRGQAQGRGLELYPAYVRRGRLASHRRGRQGRDGQAVGARAGARRSALRAARGLLQARHRDAGERVRRQAATAAPGRVRHGHRLPEQLDARLWQ